MRYKFLFSALFITFLLTKNVYSEDTQEWIDVKCSVIETTTDCVLIDWEYQSTIILSKDDVSINKDQNVKIKKGSQIKSFDVGSFIGTQDVDSSEGDSEFTTSSTGGDTEVLGPFNVWVCCANKKVIGMATGIACPMHIRKPECP